MSDEANGFKHEVNMRTHVIAWLSVLASVAMVGCDKSSALTTPTAPKPAPTPAPPSSASTFHVTGIATDDSGDPVPGAIVTVQADDLNGRPSVSGVTDARGAYSLDFQSTPRGAGVEVGYVKAESPGRDPFFGYLFPNGDGQRVFKDLHLYSSRRITAGDSTLVTVVPGDMNCGFADELTCREVHILVPVDGVLSLGCPNPALKIVQFVNYWPHAVTGGTEVIVDIGMFFTSTTSQSCLFETSLAR